MSTPRATAPAPAGRPTASHRSLTRRGLLAAGGAAGLTALLAACGDSGGSGSSDGGDGGWSFTDDRKKKVTTDSRPEKIVAFTGAAAALHDFGVTTQVAGVFGETRTKGGKADPAAGRLDVDRVEVIGNAFGEFSVERYAKLRPDLLITHMYDPDVLWYVPEESKDKILKLAPSVGVTTGRIPLKKVVERYAELAESLGADLSAERVTKAKDRYEAAAERLRRTAKGSRIRVLAVSATNDTLYVAGPTIQAELMQFKELGVDVISPTMKGQDYFESLSWENADKYDADVIMLDERAMSLQPEQLKDKPGWRDLPAVRAGQVTGWNYVAPYSWGGAAELLEDITKAIGEAKRLD
ncbi:ABC transporter substrate-binding protein [Streptomyces sp. XM4193]|uniref:ABC transporter substrate-binding protein n=1 Tax=Streptomyces sp. XM4193 TaxID=2929782 RepID=UPI001FF8477F|nr:ABC transporter substrate-binding protein [Streptomyces sp. XM4193]MCK1799039.1 ABC transporter substrate-binding protein [Streptomyces sp. XM4193]